MRELLLAFVLFLSTAAGAQRLYHYDLADGLSSSEITSICENDYYMWIATEDGLNRFDGHRFKVYKSRKSESNSLKNNNIETLFLDSRGLLWIGFKTGGADIYNPRTDRFTHLDEQASSPIPNRIVSIFEDSAHNIWLGSWEEGVCKLTPKNIERTAFTAERSHTGAIVSGFVEKPKGYVWTSTYTGLIMYNSMKQTWTEITPDSKPITQIHDTGEENTLYFSSWDNSLYELSWEYQPEQAHATLLHSGNSPIYRIKGDDEKLLTGTWGDGIKVYDKGQKRTYPLPGTEHLGTTYINDIYKDKFDNVWIGSYGKRLYKYSSLNNGIKRLLSINKTHSPVTSIALSQDRILLGTLGDGIYNFDMRASKEKENHKSKDKFKDHILSIEHGKDITLVGHDGIGLLYSFHNGNTRTPQWKEFAAGPDLEKITAFCIENDKIWIGTKQNGLMSICADKDSRQIKDYVHYDSFCRDRINAIMPYRDNQLFIASHNGLSIFDTSNKVTLKNKVIDNEIVYSIIEDKNNECWWIGTSNNLMKMLVSNDSLQVREAFPAYPLPQGAVKSLLLDGNNNLWFFIGEKIFCYISNEKRICEPNIGYWGNYSILASANTTYENKEYILFSNTEQLMAVDVEKALHQYDKTRLILTDLEINHQKIQPGDTINNRVILKENTEYTQSITLSYASKWLSLSFTETGEANHYNKYLYRMTGFSDKWQYLDMSIPLTFSQLNPGKYTLEIMKYNEKADTKPCWSMRITITPPWWETSFFYTVSCLFLLIGITFIIYMVIRHYKRKSIRQIQEMEILKKEELLKEKESFFESLGHDLITPLSLILAPANDMLREAKENNIQHKRLSIITKNAAFLSDLFSTILDFKRAELSDVKIKNKNIEIVSYCRIITNSFYYLANSKNISLSYQSNISQMNIWVDSIKFERIIYNLLSNAIKYTPEQGCVSVTLEYADGMLSVFIKDSGPGINPVFREAVFNKFYREPKYNEENAPNGLGIGLYVVKKFVSAMGGTVSIDSQPGQGTTLCVKLPAEIAEEYPEAADTYEHKGTADKQDDNITILLVEDNEQILKYLSGQLAEHFEIVTASSGEEALKMTGEYLPEIIISDIMMSGMDGLDLCRRIKGNQLYADIFVILLTAKTSSEDELKGYKEGADIYIKKPFDTEALIRQIMNILNTRQKRKEQLLKNMIAKDCGTIEFNSKEVFLQQAMKVIEENLDKADFSIEEFAITMNTSKTVLHKKFRTLIGQTPNQFIRSVRLRRAAELLTSSDLSIAEIAYLTGFNQAHYFIKCFKEVYNETPKNFRNMKMQ